MRSTARLVTLIMAGSLGAAALLPATAGAQSPGTSRATEFAAAAAEFGVPDSVLLALSYNESQWEDHAGQPSTTGAYGPMALTDVATAAASAVPSAKGDGAARATLVTAARLIGAAPAQVRSEEQDNIRAGAALLASYARAADGGVLPADVGGWYPAVAEYAGATSPAATGSAAVAAAGQTADAFAGQVYDTIRSGASRHTDDGQLIDLAAQPTVQPVGAPATPAGGQQLPECPATLSCSYVPAAYASNGPTPGDYGNYDLADRPNGHVTINYIVIHDTEESYADTVTGFQSPTDFASANYVVQGTTGTVTQMVPNEDVAWHAGNWYMNAHAIGIEQVGFAVQGATWFTGQLYQTTATLVRYLAARYHVPLDRQHIIGHDNVPGISPAYIPGMHWDPGPFWDWNRFMSLLGRRTVPTALPGSPVVTINPVFANNIQQVTDCEGGTSVPAQPSSFVYLRTGPSSSAPLFNDPGFAPGGTVGTTCAADWGDKASAGQQFVVAGRDGDWTAVWWDGAKVWFLNPRRSPVTTPTSGLIVVPRPGVSSVATYGVAYPAAGEFPADVPVPTSGALPYVIHAGQSYVYGGTTPTDYYHATTIDNSAPDDHLDILGTEKYLEIQLGHRIAFVNAADVLVRPGTSVTSRPGAKRP
jgi:hypothetical protein